MERKYIITNCKDNLTGVLIEDNKESRIEIYGASLAYSVDEIYVGRVKDVVPNINAAFVDIKPETTCYMSLEEKCKPIFLNRKNTEKVCQGDLILVQVKKEPVKTIEVKQERNEPVVDQFAPVPLELSPIGG